MYFYKLFCVYWLKYICKIDIILMHFNIKYSIKSYIK